MDYKLFLTHGHPEIGIFDIPFADYRRRYGLNPSCIAHGLPPKSMHNMKYEMDKPIDRALPPPHIMKGSAVDCILTEGMDAFNEQYSFFEGAKRYGKKWDEAKKLHGADNILLKSWDYSIRKMAEAIHSNRDAYEMLSQGQSQATVMCEILGVQCKGRMDNVNLAKARIVDLKTTAEMHRFPKVAAEFQYVAKMACYREFVEMVEGVKCDCYLVVVDGTYDVSVQEIPFQALDNKWSTCLRVIEQFRKCIETNKWPGIGNRALDIPLWAMDDEDILDYGETENVF